MMAVSRRWSVRNLEMTMDSRTELELIWKLHAAWERARCEAQDEGRVIWWLGIRRPVF